MPKHHRLRLILLVAALLVFQAAPLWAADAAGREAARGLARAGVLSQRRENPLPAGCSSSPGC